MRIQRIFGGLILTQLSTFQVQFFIRDPQGVNPTYTDNLSCTTTGDVSRLGSQLGALSGSFGSFSDSISRDEVIPYYSNVCTQCTQLGGRSKVSQTSQETREVQVTDIVLVSSVLDVNDQVITSPNTLRLEEQRAVNVSIPCQDAAKAAAEARSIRAELPSRHWRWLQRHCNLSCRLLCFQRQCNCKRDWLCIKNRLWLR